MAKWSIIEFWSSTRAISLTITPNVRLKEADKKELLS